METEAEWLARRLKQFPIVGGLVCVHVSAEQRDMICEALEIYARRMTGQTPFYGEK